MELKETIPFQHWFNKNLIRLKEEFNYEDKKLERSKKIDNLEIYPNKQSNLNDKFMKWCNEQYEK